MPNVVVAQVDQVKEEMLAQDRYDYVRFWDVWHEDTFGYELRQIPDRSWDGFNGLFGRLQDENRVYVQRDPRTREQVIDFNRDFNVYTYKKVEEGQKFLEATTLAREINDLRKGLGLME